MNEIKTNYHTHCTFCDGKESPEEVVKTAIEKGFQILGFSSHSMYPYSSDWHLPTNQNSPTNHEKYCEKIRQIKENAKDKIKILLGFEADFWEGLCKPDFKNYANFKPDYLIGSVHFVPGQNGGFYTADDGIEDTRDRINEYFNGSSKEAVCSYFDSERQMLKKANFTILGHPDLIRKQNIKPGLELFSENEEWYKAELVATAKEIKKAGVCVEINTGGIARGYMASPYPSPYFLQLLKQENVPVLLSSDAHSSRFLDFWFEEGKKYAASAGYTETAYIDSDGKIQFQKI